MDWSRQTSNVGGLANEVCPEAAKYFPDVEIIEMHHADKKTHHQGTALSTAKLIDQVRPSHESSPDEVTTLDDVRGGDYHGIRFTLYVCPAMLPMSRSCSVVLVKR